MKMRHITLAAATVAALAFALAAAHADSNYGPRQNGNQCWHHQLGNSLGYWSPCEAAKSAQAVVRPNTRTNATAAKKR